MPKRCCTTSLGIWYFLLLFSLFFIITNSFCNSSQIHGYPPPPFSTTMAIRIMATGDDGVARGVTGNTPKRRHMTSLGHFVCFFFSFFICFYTADSFYQITTRSLTFAICFNGDSHQHNDDKRQWKNERDDEGNAQETLYDVSWACGMFFFSFLILLSQY